MVDLKPLSISVLKDQEGSGTGEEEDRRNNIKERKEKKRREEGERKIGTCCLLMVECSQHNRKSSRKIIWCYVAQR